MIGSVQEIKKSNEDHSGEVVYKSVCNKGLISKFVYFSHYYDGGELLSLNTLFGS